ncbi:MAG: MerR family transcriptional regulator [Flavitalea sp.]
MNEFTIKDLENLSGIKAHTIRIWEQRYSFLKPRRSNTNIRYYHTEELKTILNIALLNKYGFKISHINGMTGEAMKNQIYALSQTEAKQEIVFNELLHFMVDLDMRNFEESLDKHIYSIGIDKAITNVIFPFLTRIGILWVTDHIKVAQEHLITNIIRQKFIMGIEQASPLQKSDKKMVLFLPTGEHHELGLLYVHYLLKIRGIEVLYLGADLPAEDLDYVCRFSKPDYVYSHLTTIPAKLDIQKYLTEIRSRIKIIPIVVSGRLGQHHHNKIPPGILIKHSLQEVIDLLTA